MKKFSELMEKSGDTAVFTFGRLNPPTTGHGKLIDAMGIQQSKNVGSKMHVFVSHSQDAKKNPLDYKRKVAYIRKMFPKYAKNITTDKARNIFEVAVSLYNKGYKSIIMVVGSDRVDEFEKLLNEYNGVKSRHGYYGFDNIEVVSAGERDPDAEGVEGMSASKMRKAAMDGDFDSFKQGVPANFKDVEKLYKDVRKSMGIREEKDMGEMDIYEEVRDAYLTGKIWNVGEIIEAKGMSGEIVRKGTNYISFVTEDNKVHKAWLHEIQLEGVVGDALKTVAKKAKDKALSKAKGAVKPALDSLNVMKKAKSAVSTAKDSMNVMKKAKSAVSTAKDSMNVVKKAKQSVGAVKDTLTAPLKKVKSLVNSEEVELDEMSWFMKAKAKIDQMTHPKAYEAMVKRFIGDMKTPSNKKKTPSSIAAEIAREYSVPSRGLIQYINKLVDKGILPKELKAEYQEESFTFKDFVNEMNEVKQDPDIKDDPGTEPAKYYKGVEKKVKPKRDAHFEKGAKMDDDNPAAYTPAPGDKGAVTKPSVHTNKFKRMYGEDRNYKKEYENYHSDPKQVKRRASRNKARREMVNAGKSVEGKDVGHKDNNPLNNSPSNLRTEDPSKNRTEPRLRNEKLGPDSTMGDYVKDFKKSDAPQFKGKTDRKKHTMAVAAFLSRNEALLDWVDQKLTENGHTDVASMKNKVAVAYKALEKMQSELEKLGDEDDLPTWWTNKVATAVSRIDDMSDYLDTQVDEAYQLDEKIAGLVKKADKSGMPYGILKKVYDRGMAAWRTGHRPGTTPQQWAMARVNSFTTKSSGTWGKADKDLASQVREMNEIDEACWDTHKQVGMKKKGGKMVPNCVPKSEEYEDELNEWGEIEEDSEYEGRKVKLNKPMAGDVKKSKVYVKNEKGNVVKVEFGDPNMTIKKHIPARRKSFRARHNCDNPGPKWKARYWSCKAW
jgi:hypothetical protein